MAHTTSPIDATTVTALTSVAHRNSDVRRQVYSPQLSEAWMRQTVTAGR